MRIPLVDDLGKGLRHQHHRHPSGGSQRPGECVAHFWVQHRHARGDRQDRPHAGKNLGELITGAAGVVDPLPKDRVLVAAQRQEMGERDQWFHLGTDRRRDRCDPFGQRRWPCHACAHTIAESLR